MFRQLVPRNIVKWGRQRGSHRKLSLESLEARRLLAVGLWEGTANATGLSGGGFVGTVAEIPVSLEYDSTRKIGELEGEALGSGTISGFDPEGNPTSVHDQSLGQSALGGVYGQNVHGRIGSFGGRHISFHGVYNGRFEDDFQTASGDWLARYHIDSVRSPPVPVGVEQRGTMTGDWTASGDWVHDILITKTEWSVDRSFKYDYERGFDVTYEVTSNPAGITLPETTEIAYYWAEGESLDDIIEEAGERVEIESKPGEYSYNEEALWGVPPEGTTHVLIVADPDDRVLELGELPEPSDVDDTNNFMALELHPPDEILASGSVRRTVSGGEINATFVPGSDQYTLSEAEVSLGVHHFNWIQQITSIPKHWEWFINSAEDEPTVRVPAYDPSIVVSNQSEMTIYSGLAGVEEDFGASPNDDGIFYHHEDGPRTSYDVELQMLYDTLYFRDEPEVPEDFFGPNEYWSFKTWLSGVDKDGGVVPLPHSDRLTFTWKSDYGFDGSGEISSANRQTVGAEPPKTSGGVFDVVDATIDPLIAMDDQVATAYGTPITIDVLSNDSDSFSGSIEIAQLGTAAHGTVAVDDRGTLTTDDDQIVYWPEAGFGGTDRFFYTISPLGEERSGASTAYVTVDVASPASDYGDIAESKYPTLRSDDGARHLYRPGFYLGDRITTETDARVGSAITGDHGDDGVHFLSPIVPGTTPHLEVSASQDGVLDAWFDFNGDGDWDDLGEYAFAATTLSAGVNDLTLAIPADVTTGEVVARFRYSSQGIDHYLGNAMDGEVEDYRFIVDSSSIEGLIWQDDNANQVRDTSETGLAFWKVFLDEDGDRQWDTDETFTYSDDSGHYRFDSLTPGSYDVVQVLPDEWAATASGTAWNVGVAFADSGSGQTGNVGVALAVAGDKAYVGDPLYVVNERNVGAVLVYDLNSDELLHTILGPGDQISSGFGTTVVGVGDRVLVGAPQKTVDGYTSAGAAYLFDSDTAALLQTFHNPEPTVFGQFGHALAGAGAGALALVGAPGNLSQNIEGAGTAYLVNLDSGGVVQTISSPEPQSLGYFGSSVLAVDGLVLVGAPGHFASGVPQAGKAYLIDPNTLNVARSFENPVPEYLGQFADAMVQDGNVLFFAAPGTDIAEIRDAGMVHAFNLATGTLLGSIPNPEPAELGEFGKAILFEDGELTVGAPGNASNGQDDAGMVYRMDLSSGAADAAIANRAIESLDRFGSSLQRIGEQYLIAAPLARAEGGSVGVVYRAYLETGVYHIDLDANVSAADADFGNQPISTQVLDFGDAPLPYPTVLADRAARHVPTGPQLGIRRDAESDGSPSVSAKGDDTASAPNDEDGVILLTSLLATTDVATIATAEVTITGSGMLNGWVDFNQDGDWLDEGERILDRIAVSPGQHRLSFTVPSGASAGETYARFRLSTDADLSPAGPASDGEVEDYQLTIDDGNAVPDVFAGGFTVPVFVDLSSSEMRVFAEQQLVFRSPVSQVGQLRLDGNPGDDAFTLTIGPDFVLPANGLLIDGQEGENQLIVVGNHGMLDLTDSRVSILAFNLLDLSSIDVDTVVLNAEVVASMAPTTKTLFTHFSEGDQLIMRDADEWRMSEPVIVDGHFMLKAHHVHGAEAAIVSDWPRHWQNLLHYGDVNNSGYVSALDALLIINELNDPKYTSETSSKLPDGNTMDVWPGVYLDCSGDGYVSALDALRVINELNAMSTSSASASGEPDGDATPVVLEAANMPQSLKLDSLDSAVDNAIVIDQERKPSNQSQWVSGKVVPSASIDIDESSEHHDRDRETAVDQLLGDQLFRDRGWVETLTDQT